MKEKKILVVLALLAVLGIVMAEQMQDTKIEALNARLDRLECMVEFTKSQIDLIAEEIPQAPDMSSHKGKLDNDIDELQGYADVGNINGFNSFIQTNLKPDMQDATSDIIDVKRNLRTYNLSLTTWQTLRAEFSEIRETYTECLKSNVINIAQKNLDYYEAFVKHSQEVISTMDSKDYDTSEMSSILSEFKEEVMDPLDAAIATGNVDEIRETRQESREKHLHAWANFNIARFNQYVAKLESADVDNEYTEEIESIKENIDNAEEIASKVKYSRGDPAKIYNYLKQAALEIGDLARKMSGK